uniref:Uncharacterized protein n=1 Tax=Nucleocytoviricota sp. TaxID=2809609 RepID=A0A9E8K1D0_9VIRU|nr:hypothetical protein [Nucleocytoviricota sp.]
MSYSINNNSNNATTQNELLLKKLLDFYKNDDNIDKMLNIINGKKNVSLRIIDWFVTNYSKKNFTIIDKKNGDRIKVFNSYKLNLKAYSKKKFDPFCRWDRITIPYKNDLSIQTTIGQLNFFKWALDNEIIDYINDNYQSIDNDMCIRNSTTKNKSQNIDNNKTRKKREELSINASKSIKKELVEIVVEFK